MGGTRTYSCSHAYQMLSATKPETFYQQQKAMLKIILLRKS